MLELLIALKWPLLILQLVVTPILILMILLQPGKGDDIGSALGGMGNSGVSGTGGVSKFLTRGTAIFAIIFMVNSIALAKIFKEVALTSVGTSVTEPIAPGTAPDTAPAPQVPAAPAPANP